MKVTNKRLEEIKPYPNNPRRNDKAVQYVMNSIKEFGFNVPLIIDAEGVIIAGHTRYEACKRLGIKEVQCIVADDLTEDQTKAFRIADNATHEMSKWDYGLLVGELGSIEDLDMEQFGFGSLDALDVQDDTEQDFDDSAEVSVESFDDSRFEVVCPCCGFRFNED